MSEIEKLIKLIESLRQTEHDSCEDDTWYSCPLHPNYSGNQSKNCLCFFYENNAAVDEALQIVRGLTLREWMAWRKVNEN